MAVAADVEHWSIGNRPTVFQQVLLTAILLLVVARQSVMARDSVDPSRELQHHACHDEPTGLPTRRSLLELLGSRVHRREHRDRTCSPGASWDDLLRYADLAARHAAGHTDKATLEITEVEILDDEHTQAGVRAVLTDPRATGRRTHRAHRDRIVRCGDRSVHVRETRPRSAMKASVWLTAATPRMATAPCARGVTSQPSVSSDRRAART